MIGIYILEFSNGKKYIGQSNDISRRIGEHMEDMSGCHKNHRIRVAVALCGLPSWRVLEECSLGELNAAEIKWIRHYDTFRNGCNLTIGGGYARKGVSRNPSVSDAQLPVDAGVGLVYFFIAAFVIGLIVSFFFCPPLIWFILIGVILTCLR